MLAKHSFAYAFAKGIPGLIGFFSISIYSHYIGAADYGKYAVIMSTVLLANAGLFQWIRLSLLRYLPVYESKNDQFFATVRDLFFVTAIVCSVFAFFLYKNVGVDYKDFVILGYFLLIFTAYFELGLEYFRANLSPVKYGYALCLKSILLIGFSVLFLEAGYGIYGIIYSILISIFVSALLFGNKVFFVKKFGSWEIGKKFFTYGGVLALGYMLAGVINAQDRYLIMAFLGEKEAGLYSLSYDFINSSLVLLMSIVNLAAYPIVTRAFEKYGVDAARRQLEHNFTLLMAVSIPALIGIFLVSSDIVNILFGPDFREGASVLIPWLLIGVFFCSVRNFYFDLAFHLVGKAHLLLWVFLWTALSAILINIILIPVLGIRGAAISSALAYLLSIFLSVHYSRKWLIMPIPIKPLLHIFVSTAGMALAVLCFKYFISYKVVYFDILVGVFSYVFFFLALNVCGARNYLKDRLIKLRLK